MSKHFSMKNEPDRIELKYLNSKQVGGTLHDLEMPPIEKYRTLDGYEFNVIRDDLPFPFPSPNFSKIRGIAAHFEKLHEAGVRKVASQDTIIARVGWGVGYFAKKYDMKHWGFYPEGHDDFYRGMMKSFGSAAVPLMGTHQRIVRGWAEKWLEKNNVNDCHFLPTGLRLDESKTEHMHLVECLKDKLDCGGTLVMIISSGTILSGLLAGIIENEIDINVKGVLVHGFKGRKQKVISEARRMTSLYHSPLWPDHKEKFTFEVYDDGYDYNQKARMRPPFPCDRFLDGKAFTWMMDNIMELEPPIYFWNVGGEWSPDLGVTDDLLGDGVTSNEDILKYLKKHGVIE